MDENDKRVRKQWLVIWALSVVNSVANILLQLRFDPSLEMLSQARSVVTALTLLFVGVFGLITYRCVYRKPGTKLLTFCLILTALALASTPILYLTGKLSLPTYIPYYGVYLMVTQGIGALWLVVCWKMRKVNKKLQVLSKQPA